MIVRTANITDAPNIAQIHVETWRTAYRGQISEAVLDALSVERRTAFWHERISHAGGSVLVAEDGAVVGFCDLIPSRDEDAGHGMGEIAAIYVHAPHWRQGVGRALCEGAWAEARRQGFEEVTLWSLASNGRARRFYEAMGFRLDGATKSKQASDGSEWQEVRFRRRLV